MKSSLITTPNILFVALSAVFFAFAFRPLHPMVAHSDEGPTPYEQRHYIHAPTDSSTLSTRAQQYRQQLAIKLNRQRIETEYNARFAQKPEAVERSVNTSQDNLAFGVEAIRRHASGDIPVDQNQPEMQIQNDLMRKQAMAQQDRNSRAQFIAQYIANARAQGYVVTVDGDFNVEVIRGPNSVDGRGPQSVAADMSGPASGSIDSTFIRAPFCQ